MLLTIDLGTSATKTALWEGDSLVDITSTALVTVHSSGGRAEQDPAHWWSSVVQTTRTLLARQRSAASTIDRIAFSAARESFVPVDEQARPLGAAILWSDRRGADFAAEVADRFGGRDSALTRTGQRVDAGTMAAKVAWVAAHENERLRAARWLLAPRDAIILEMVGAAVTDPTLALRTGFYDTDLCVVAPEEQARLLPPVVGSDTVVGTLTASAADRLGMRRSVEVVVGAGDRACEVIGSGSGPSRPMTSWGTTANSSVPSQHATVLPGWSLSAGAIGEWVCEAGLSAAGSAIEWLSRMTGQAPTRLHELARTSPAGSNGVVAAPFFNGARAPWWIDGATGGFAGIRSTTTTSDLARATIEAVATDIAVAHEALPIRAEATVLAGGGADDALWQSVLAASLVVPVITRFTAHAASVGARMLGAAHGGVDALNPIVRVTDPDAGLVDVYADVIARRRQFVERLTAT